jgi:hypothetical protein
VKQFITLLLFILLYSNAKSQLGYNDTNYYKIYPGSIIGRFYFSQKYTAITLQDKNAKDLKYWPNTTLNMGVGATYHNVSLNLAYGFKFLNQDEDKGETKYLDMQGHYYRPKFVVDFLGQFYKGYHLEPKGFVPTRPDAYYYQRDAKVNLLGLSAYHIFNSTRFSYKAAFIQNAWQKKSAGTFLLGAEAYYGIIKSDSTWIPSALDSLYENRKDIYKINYFSIGPGVGYAYTAVAFQHLFITGSLTANLSLTYTTERNSNTHSKFSVNPLTRFRIAAGYNSNTWDISANWVADRLPFQGYSGSGSYLLQTGNYRLIIARKFMPGPKTKKHLQPVDKVIKE